MTRDIKAIVSQMTLEEKAGLCSGLDSMQTKPIERLGIPSMKMIDGPHGVRKRDTTIEKAGLYSSVPATCFPTAAGSACSWDVNLLYEIGSALGEEFQAADIEVMLGPGVNIKRSPLCGRNFEYFSEEPLVASEMAAGLINGVQSQGVGTSLKHFALNNQEHRRMTVNAKVDERTLREIYLASFEGVVKKAQPWTIMCAYNSVNGEFCSENSLLLSQVRKEEWGHEGIVVTDWGALNERVKGLVAGLELEMPTSYGIGDQKIIDAIHQGHLSEEVLDEAVTRLLTVIFKTADGKKVNASYDKNAHHELARKAARESIVLLKNKNEVLPLKKSSTLAVIGAFVKEPRFQGGGSSHINPTMVDDVIERLVLSSEGNIKVAYAEGYHIDNDDIDEQLIAQAMELAAKTDVAVIFAGLPDRYECEGYDREHMRMPENHSKLIEAVAKVQSNVVVVLCNGAPIEMPWADKVEGILEAYLGGQGFGGAIADILLGNSNPCGKLAESFPRKLSDNPSYLNFPGEDDCVDYREGLFVGYRYYDKKEIKPLFPFGYGLSYTNFKYTDISIDKKEMSDLDTLTVKVKVKNTGKVAGKEIIQLYVKDIESSAIRPEKELKGFEKIELAPNEEKEITFILNKRSFAYYNTDIKDWYVESGEFEILIGKSSKAIEQKQTLYVKSSTVIKKKYHRNTPIGDLKFHQEGVKALNDIIKLLCVEGNELSPLKDDPEMMESVLKNLPLRTAISFSGGVFTESMMDSLIDKLNTSN